MLGISQMMELVGFSMEKSLPEAMQYNAISAQKSAMRLPFSTLMASVFDICSGGKPAGSSVVRSGLGFGMFGYRSSFQCGIGISRARVYVPHGGARCT